MYLFAVLLLSAFAYLEVFNKDIIEKNKPVCIFVCFTFLVFHDGFRWETGCDWLTYTDYFDKLLDDYSIDDPLFEVGYYLLLLPIKTITDNYTVYLVVHALIFYGLVFYATFKLSNSPFVSLLLLYMVIVPYMGTNRQFLAIAVYSIGLLLLNNKKYIAYVLLVILACFFHKSAMICLVVLLLNRKIKNLYLGILLFAALLIFISGIVDKITPMLSVFLSDENTLKKFDVYTTMTYDTNLFSLFFSLVRKLIWIGILMLFDKKIENKPPAYYLFFNMYFIGSIIYILFNGTMLQVIVFRAMLYFNIAEIFLVPYVLLLFKQNYGKLAIMFLLSAYVMVNIQKGFANYGENTDYFEPYKGLFINSDYVRRTL